MLDGMPVGGPQEPQDGQMGGPAPDMAAQPPAPPMGPPEPQQFFDVTVVRKRKYGCAKVEAVPPEEFGVSRKAKLADGMNSVDYCFHETTKSARELIAQGFDKAQVKDLPTDSNSTTQAEELARDTVDDNSGGQAAGANWVTRQHKVTEHYARLDYEGNGKLKLYRITTAAQGDILKRKGKPAIDEIDEIPFAAMSPIIVTHRFYGRSIADIVMDIQRIKTALIRALLDGIYLANNQRLEIAESHSTPETIDDILNNRPGGIVRTKQPGGLLPIPNQDISASIYPALEYQDAQREWRTGVTRQGQGIDAKALQDQSATAAAQLFTMAQARMRLVARIFAETGIRDLFLLLHGIIRRNDRQQNTVRLRNKWVTVDPQDWKRRNDMTVHVGVGTGGKGEQLVFLMQLLGIQKEAVLSGSGLATTENIYNTLRKVVEIAGLKSIDPYFTDPKTQPPPQTPPDPKVMAVQQKGESDKAKMQVDVQMQAEKLKQDQLMAQQQANLDMEKMQREFDLKREQMQAEFALKQQQIAAEIDLKRQLGFLGAATDAHVASEQVRLGGQPG